MHANEDPGLCPKEKKCYVNPHIHEIRRGIYDVFLWKTGRFKDVKDWPIAPDSFKYPIPELKLDPGAPKVVWINHCTFLISIDGVNILTDPIWSHRCSPVPFVGPKRRHSPAMSLNDLPKIDCVLISHNHYDHLDKKTVKWLNAHNPEIIWMVPSGVKKWFQTLKIENVVELSWWESAELKHNESDLSLITTAVPAQHFSGRSPLDLNQTLWAGWVVQIERGEKNPSKRFYFVGDTGYNPHDFKKIGEKWNSMDLSLIPIGTYLPREFMSPVHIEPIDSVKIHKEVGSRLSVGMHWKTFHLSDEPLHQPPYDLLSALQNEGLDPSTFLALEPGHAINW